MLRISPLLSHSVRQAARLSTASATSSTVNAEEIALFSRLSSQWWNEKGEFGLLHKMNPVRMQFVREKILEVSRDEDEHAAAKLDSTSKILNGLDVLDVGCGGGILSESLARLGARTLGIDASSSNIGIASVHASKDPSLPPSSLTYRNVTAEQLLEEDQRFDVVCSMEVIEHVDNPARFLHSCAELVKPGGHLFLSTIARTPLSYLLTIFAAEHVLRLVSPGTHTHSKFVNPSELLDFFTKSPQAWISRLYGGSPSRHQAEIRGLVYLPWKGSWVLAPRGAWGATECNYVFWARKPMDLQ
ncbi:3-demethylubiquinone-9 3-methyltransferase [Schizopora paradoxa]|uniref:Ubiquinone biosynthesis O-methyltransferase, mitochondrial n=1 Tax=Schizopora paradoxa TaxID=27342 RepID=A0A0H2RM84_9AGAM|nr:3-demethylubiquinone-9 3-methyltransferase [Schizopora paradoxa]